MTVKLNLKPLDALRLEISQGLKVPRKRGPIDRVFLQWGKVVRGYLQERFVRESRGGGQWRRLSASTLAARRTKKRRRGKDGARRRSIRTVRFATGASSQLSAAPRILRDTGTLFRALNPVFSNRPGAIQRDIPFGVRIGFGGPDRHADGKVTVAQIARWHQTGAGKLPVRKIIVDPPLRVQAQMARLMQAALDKLK